MSFITRNYALSAYDVWKRFVSNNSVLKVLLNEIYIFKQHYCVV